MREKDYWEYLMQNEEARLRRILPETKQPIFCIPNVSTSTRLGPTKPIKRTVTEATFGSSSTDASPKYERLVKRTRRDMEDEGPSRNRKVLPQYPSQYKKDEEESEGQTDMPDSEEERMENWASFYTCDYCGRMATNTSFPYCSENCREREWDSMQQERDNHYDFLCASTDSLLTSFFSD